MPRRKLSTKARPDGFQRNYSAVQLKTLRYRVMQLDGNIWTIVEQFSRGSNLWTNYLILILKTLTRPYSFQSVPIWLHHCTEHKTRFVLLYKYFFIGANFTLSCYSIIISFYSVEFKYMSLLYTGFQIDYPPAPFDGTVSII